LKVNFSNHCNKFSISARPPKRCQSELPRILVPRSAFNIIVRKLAKRLEDLIQDSNALKPHLLPQMKALSNLVPELVNFGISVRNLTEL
jgi:hypothetical protein